MVDKRTVRARRALTHDIGSAVAWLLEAVRSRVKGWLGKGMVTLDIDSNTVRLLETKRGTVRKWTSISLSKSLLDKPDQSQGEPALGTVVKQLMTASGIKARKVVASLSGLYSVSRIVTLPSLPAGTTIQQAVLEMARETMPLPEDRLYLSWQAIANGDAGQRVIILGTPPDIVDSEVQALRKAGINPQVLELKAVALARAVNREQALILNIEPSSFDIVIVVDGIPEIMRTTPWQQDGLMVADKVEHLALSLDLTVDFFNLRHTDTRLNPATPLFITGQATADISLMEKLQARLRYPIEPLSPPLQCPADLPIAQYAVNIGLALRETAPRSPAQHSYFPVDVNLLPKVYWPWRPTLRQLYPFGLIILGIALLVPVYRTTSQAFSKTADLQARYSVLDSQLKQRQLEIKNRVPLEAAIDEYQAITNMSGYFTEDLEVIRRQAERLGIELHSIAHEGKTISVSCEANSYLTFRNYLTALEESGRFASPIPPPEGYPYTKAGVIQLKPKAKK